MYLVANYIAFLSPPLQVMRRENNFLLSAGGLKGALPFGVGYAQKPSVLSHLLSPVCLVIDLTFNVHWVLFSPPKRSWKKKNGPTEYPKGEWYLIRMFLHMTNHFDFSLPTQLFFFPFDRRQCLEWAKLGKSCFPDLRIKGKSVFFICTILRNEAIQG